MTDIAISPPLETDKCYVLTVTMSNFTAVGSVFTLELGATTQVIGTVNSNGVTTFAAIVPTNAFNNLNYTTASTFDVDSVDLRLDESCATSACSECFSLETTHDCPGTNTLLLVGNNNECINDLNLSNFVYNFQALVIGGIQHPEYSYDEEIDYSSDGGRRVTYADRNKVEQLVINDAPPYIHDYYSLMLVLDDLTIDGAEYIKSEGGYQPEYDKSSLMGGAFVNIEKKTQKVTNNNCS